MKELENKFVSFLEEYTYFYTDEDGDIEHFQLYLNSNMDIIVWQNPKHGYLSIGLTDSLGHPYVDFGTFHSRGCPEAFIIGNEERRWHPVIAMREIQKKVENLLLELTDIQNMLIEQGYKLN